MLELHIDSELKAWIDPLSAEEYALLEASILRDGCRDPLVVWNGWLLDGHNRYEICRKHGIEFQTFEKAGLKTKEDVKIWMIENQMGRRNATDFTRVALALKLKPLIEAKAKANHLANAGNKASEAARPNSDAPLEKIRTDAEVAKLAGVGKDAVRKVEKIIEKAAPEVIQKARTGEISINAAAAVAKLPLERQEEVAAAGPAEIKKVASELRKQANQPAPMEPSPLAESIDQVNDIIQTLQEEIALLQEKVATLRAAADPDILRKLQEMQAYIKVVERQRNDWQNQCNDLTKEVKRLRKQLEKVNA